MSFLVCPKNEIYLAIIVAHDLNDVPMSEIEGHTFRLSGVQVDTFCPPTPGWLDMYRWCCVKIRKFFVTRDLNGIPTSEIECHTFKLGGVQVGTFHMLPQLSIDVSHGTAYNLYKQMLPNRVKHYKTCLRFAPAHAVEHNWNGKAQYIAWF
jgi:hypothetical protein